MEKRIPNLNNIWIANTDLSLTTDSYVNKEAQPSVLDVPPWQSILPKPDAQMSGGTKLSLEDQVHILEVQVRELEKRNFALVNENKRLMSICKKQSKELQPKRKVEKLQQEKQLNHKLLPPGAKKLRTIVPKPDLNQVLLRPMLPQPMLSINPFTLNGPLPAIQQTFAPPKQEERLKVAISKDVICYKPRPKRVRNKAEEELSTDIVTINWKPSILKHK